MTDHDACCCTETLTDLGALKAAYWSTCSAYTAACHELAAAVAERDRARDTAARLEAELARGFRITAPPATLTRHDEDRPAATRQMSDSSYWPTVMKCGGSSSTASSAVPSGAKAMKPETGMPTFPKLSPSPCPAGTGEPATPNHPDNGDGIVQIRPGSGNTPPDTHAPERGHDTGGKVKHV